MKKILTKTLAVVGALFIGFAPASHAAYRFTDTANVEVASMDDSGNMTATSFAGDGSSLTNVAVGAGAVTTSKIDSEALLDANKPAQFKWVEIDLAGTLAEGALKIGDGTSAYSLCFNSSCDDAIGGGSSGYLFKVNGTEEVVTITDSQTTVNLGDFSVTAGQAWFTGGDVNIGLYNLITGGLIDGLDLANHAHDGTADDGVQLGSGALLSNAVTTDKIADASVTTAKIAKSGCTNGQVLKWNDSNNYWTCSADSEGAGVSYPLSADSGNVGAPSYSWSVDGTDGLYHTGTLVAMAINGAQVASFGATAFDVTGNITVSGTVDGVDLANHDHDGTATGGTQLSGAAFSNYAIGTIKQAEWDLIAATSAICTATPGDNNGGNPTAEPVFAYSTSDYDLYTATGTGIGQWRNSRTGAGPC